MRRLLPLALVLALAATAPSSAAVRLHPGDILVAGMKIAQRLVDTEPLRGYVARAHEPAQAPGSDDEWLQYLRARGGISYHPVGTCRMGSDAGAVVDASIMPTLVSGNTNAPTIMIGEKGASMILEDLAARK